MCGAPSLRAGPTRNHFNRRRARWKSWCPRHRLGARLARRQRCRPGLDRGNWGKRRGFHWESVANHCRHSDRLKMECRRHRNGHWRGCHRTPRRKRPRFSNPSRKMSARNIIGRSDLWQRPGNDRTLWSHVRHTRPCVAIQAGRARRTRKASERWDPHSGSPPTTRKPAPRKNEPRLHRVAGEGTRAEATTRRCGFVTRQVSTPLPHPLKHLAAGSMTGAFTMLAAVFASRCGQRVGEKSNHLFGTRSIASHLRSGPLDACRRAEEGAREILGT